MQKTTCKLSLARIIWSISWYLRGCTYRENRHLFNAFYALFNKRDKESFAANKGHANKEMQSPFGQRALGEKIVDARGSVTDLSVPRGSHRRCHCRESARNGEEIGKEIGKTPDGLKFDDNSWEKSRISWIVTGLDIEDYRLYLVPPRYVAFPSIIYISASKIWALQSTYFYVNCHGRSAKMLRQQRVSTPLVRQYCSMSTANFASKHA